MNKTLNLSEAASMLKVCKQTAQRMASRGEIPAARIGRSWVFIESDLIGWLRQESEVQQTMRKVRFIPKSKTKILNITQPRSRRNTPPSLEKYNHLFTKEPQQDH